MGTRYVNPYTLKHRKGGTNTRPMYSFPVAAVTNYHKLSGLNQHKFINLQGAGQKSKMGGRAVFLQQAPGRTHVLAFSSF